MSGANKSIFFIVLLLSSTISQNVQIAEYKVATKIQSQYAKTAVSSVMWNNNEKSQNATFVVQIPENAFISVTLCFRE